MEVSRYESILEAYTVPLAVSVGASHNEILPAYGEKPKEQDFKFSRKRVHRGLFRTAQNWYINADCNGAVNIINKVPRRLG